MNEADRFAELVHDMRNRLTIIRANVEAFIDGKLEPSAERLGSLLQSLTMLEGMLKDFRSNATVGPSTVSLQDIDVCATLGREYQAIEALASAKNIAFDVVRCPVTSEACRHFLGDPGRVGQIVSNVLLNAVTYTPSGGAIRVDCARHGGELEISVSDDGPGLDEGEAEHVFQAGYRGSAAEGKTGSGFGLAIAKELVEAQGGTISVAAAREHGARFTVRLPGTSMCGDTDDPRCAACSAAHHHR